MVEQSGDLTVSSSEGSDPGRGRDGRSRILEAIVDVIADEGIERASVRAVAQRAGVSIGAVQHHFRTKAQMLEGAMSFLTVQFEAHAHSAASQADPGLDDDVRDDRENPSAEPLRPGQALAVLRAMCQSLALIDEADRRAGGVWLDFVAASRVHEGLAGIHQGAWARLRGTFASLLEVHTPAHPSPQAAADLLLAGLDGIAVSRMTEPHYMTAARAEAVAEAALAAALSPPAPPA